jgi:hypothetical protein
MSLLLPAELAWYVTGRFYRRASGELADYGYFLHLAGVSAPLFAGEPGEATAHLTFAAVPFQAGSLVNGALTLALDPVGEFSVYLQREPAGTFDDPLSFARGERIATFRRTSMVVGTTVAGARNDALVGDNVFSARLVHSTPFELGGAIYDLALLVGAGVTQLGTAAGRPIVPPAAGYAAVVPFSGSALALGLAR